MTWPMTLAGLSRAGAVSKPHHYKQNVQKMKGLLKKRAWTENSLKFSNQKAKSSTPPMKNKTKDPQESKGKAEHEPCSQEEINWSEIEKKHSEGNCSNSARPELRSQVLTCSTFTYSRLVMTWPLTLAGLPRAGAVSNPHHYKQNVQKMKGLLKKRALTDNNLKFSNQKAKNSSQRMENKTKEPQDPREKTEHETCSQEEINWIKIERSIQNITVRTLKTRTKKSSPDLFNFYVIWASHDLANYAGRATTWRRNFKARWLQTERTRNDGPSEKTSFNGEQFENFKPKKPRNPFILWRTKQKNHKTLKAKTEPEPCSQEENNWSKFEKSIQNKTVRTLQD